MAAEAPAAACSRCRKPAPAATGDGRSSCHSRRRRRRPAPCSRSNSFPAQTASAVATPRFAIRCASRAASVLQGAAAGSPSRAHPARRSSTRGTLLCAAVPQRRPPRCPRGWRPGCAVGHRRDVLGSGRGLRGARIPAPVGHAHGTWRPHISLSGAAEKIFPSPCGGRYSAYFIPLHLHDSGWPHKADHRGETSAPAPGSIAPSAPGQGGHRYN